MKEKIKTYFENLNPEKLGLKNKIKVGSVSRLGQGASNLNYLVRLDGKKFIFRMNMEPDKKNKSKKEFDALVALDSYDIGPKAWLIDESKKYFDSEFIILSYIEGNTLDKIPGYFKPKMFRKIGKLCGELHAIKIKGKLKKLKKEFLCSYKKQVSMLKKEYLNDLNKKLGGKKLMKIIDESFSNLYSKTSSKKYVSILVLDQGDFHEGNIVVHGDEYKLIDFEDLQITDRAISLANIFSDFGKPFNEGQKKLFFDEYFKIIKVDRNDLMERIDIRIPIEIFSVFLWSIWHTLRVRDGELHSAFLEKNDIKEDLEYVDVMFKRCLKFGLIDKKYKGFDAVGALG